MDQAGRADRAGVDRVGIVGIDPLAPLVALPGVAEAAEKARDALSAVHRHRANLRGWDKTATEASWRAGRSSAAIDGGSVELRRDGDFDDPILAGAMRVAQALDGDSLDQLTGVFRRAPAQALARLHMLAAADMVDDPDELGRPRAGADVAARLDLLGQLISGATTVPPIVLTGWQMLICAVPTVIGAFVLGEGPWFVPSWQSIAVIAYIALIPMAIGNFAWFSIVGLLPTTYAVFP